MNIINTRCIQGVKQFEILWHTPSSREDAYRLGELGKFDTNQRFGEHIGRHVVGSMVGEDNGSFVKGLTDVVVADGNVLGARMKYSILDQLYSQMVVAVDCDWIFEYIWRVEFWEKVLNPDSLFCSMHDPNIFSLSAQKCDGRLLLWGPQDSSPIKVEDISTDRMAVVNVVAPVGISEPHDSSSSSKFQLPVTSPLEITKCTFGLFPVRATRILEVLRKSGDSKGDIQSSSNSSIHKWANDLLIRDVSHIIQLARSRWRLILHG